MPAGAPAGGVFVELRSDNPNVRIDRDFGGPTVPVCFAPCRKVLERNSLYIIQGDGIRPTSRFVLPDDRDRVTLDVHAGSSARMAAAAVLLVAGGVVGYAGLVLIETAPAVQASSNLAGDTTTNNRAVRTGLVFVAIGLPAVAVGLYLAATAGTSVTSSTGASFTEGPAARRGHPRFALTPRGLEF